MDIDAYSFYSSLPTILNDIGQALFVAIDLELSGVPLKQTRVAGSGKQNLQQRYDQVRHAAKKYQILQIGLTPVRRDTESGLYVCKPYNIPISPLIQESGIDIEREVVFSSSAATFLRSVSFDFSKPFNDGVCFLTGDEVDKAKDAFKARNMRVKHTKLDVKSTDLEAHAFLSQTRKAIDAWLKPSQQDSFLNIGPPALQRPDDRTDTQPEMTKYQKWLVHHLVEVEYPQLKSFGKRSFIQIVHLDREEERKYEVKRQSDFDHRIARQKGFSWVIEALLGQQLSTSQLARLVHEAEAEEDDPAAQQSINRRQRELEAVMPHQPSIVVGHNCFLDFVYLYQTFIGELPDSVEDYAQALHRAFPMLIDTKYMATHNCGDIPPNSSLEELAYRFQPQNPDDRIDTVAEEHDKYNESDAYHEAGFDSLMTAQVAIRLSRQLESEGFYVEEAEDGGVSLSPQIPEKKGVVSKVVDKSVAAVSTSLAALGLQSKASSKTDTHHGAEGVPGFESDFWRVYGNRMRVFGTEETVLLL